MTALGLVLRFAFDQHRGAAGRQAVLPGYDGSPSACDPGGPDPFGAYGKKCHLALVPRVLGHRSHPILGPGLSYSHPSLLCHHTKAVRDSGEGFSFPYLFRSE